MYITPHIKIIKSGQDKWLICNGLTGEVLVTNSTGYQFLSKLQHEETVNCDPGLLNVLRGKRIVFADKEEEERLFAEVCNKSWRDFRRHAPRHYTFIINTDCNFNCPYCFEREELRARARMLSTAQVDAAFSIIDRYAQRHSTQQRPQFEVFGGEPLLPRSRNLLCYLLEQIADRGYTTSLQTNGYYLTRYLDFFETYQDHIGQLQVTLDGPKTIHDKRRIPRNGAATFDRIVAGIQAVATQNPLLRINIRINVDRENVDYLEEMAKFYTAQGWTSDGRFTFTAAPVDNRSGTLKDPSRLVGWCETFQRTLPLSIDSAGGPFDLSVFKSIDYFRYLFSTVRDANHEQPLFIPKVIYCEAASLKLFAFHPDGRIYPCPETVGVADLAIGTYYPEFALNYQNAKQWAGQTILKRRQCRECDIATFCGGGCALASLLQHGSMSQPVCEDAESIVDSYFSHVFSGGG